MDLGIHGIQAASFVLEKKPHRRREINGPNTRIPVAIKMARRRVLLFLKKTVEKTEKDKGTNPMAALGENTERLEEPVARFSSILS